MAVSDVAAFWSYSHEDNELDGDAVVRLAESLRNEFALVTGEVLTLFVDRASIGWGDEWRRRIEGALADTTFFIPIITPRYFARPECRRELLDFSSHAQSLGVSELILPIRYSKVRDLSEQNPDEAVALIARMQYVDWTHLRLRDPSSSEYRTAVNALAVRLADLADDVAERQLSGELHEAREPENDELGLSDLLDRINGILPEWLQAIDDVHVDVAQSNATYQVYSRRIKKAERSGPASARYAILQRLAADEMPIAERSLGRAQLFAAKTIELDPLILSVARIEAGHPIDRTLFTDLRSAVMTAHRNHLNNIAAENNPVIIDAAEWTAKRAHTSRAMRRLSQIYVRQKQTIYEANGIIKSWVEQFTWLRDEPSEGSPVSHPK